MRGFRSVWLSALLFGVLVGGVARAKTVTAPSCELSAVQSAVDSASAGDTVVIPAGSCTWNGTLSITKPMTLKGSGTAKTRPANFGAGTTPRSSPTTPDTTQRGERNSSSRSAA